MKMKTAIPLWILIGHLNVVEIVVTSEVEEAGMGNGVVIPAHLMANTLSIVKWEPIPVMQPVKLGQQVLVLEELFWTPSH
jgi:hypothetical protein